MSKTWWEARARLLFIVGTLIPGVAAPMSLSAQTAQPWSLQVSGLGSAPFGGGFQGLTNGGGFEGQIRYNHSAFSVGVGGDMTFHTVEGAEDRSTTLAGGFVEPRYVIDIGKDRAAPYLSARGAVSQISIDFGSESSTAVGLLLNGGGGLLLSLNDRVNIDIGATLGYRDLGIIESPLGTFDLGTGSNLIGRLGLAFGLGG